MALCCSCGFIQPLGVLFQPTNGCMNDLHARATMTTSELDIVTCFGVKAAENEQAGGEASTSVAVE